MESISVTDTLRQEARMAEHVRAWVLRHGCICGADDRDVPEQHAPDCRVAGMIEALERITRREGRYSRDPLTHASNTVEDMATVAEEALTG